jgi:hypothetical protein
MMLANEVKCVVVDAFSELRVSLPSTSGCTMHAFTREFGILGNELEKHVNQSDAPFTLCMKLVCNENVKGADYSIIVERVYFGAIPHSSIRLIIGLLIVFVIYTKFLYKWHLKIILG